ncbi:YARHG domain-containing protein [Aureispira anguillae]|uniref:YARHG domain-containing protein n=1 Tax=Aureispira anguillae TaxID=2864201 RepID=A0A915YE43_9BACT|nr:YARHG domain-containing protein [Aureispira anguillae]BDS11429.1 YARHG domain-containing protein [Aureispira anguillae]
MKALSFMVIFVFLISGCQTEIKNSDAKIEEEEGTKVAQSEPHKESKSQELPNNNTPQEVSKNTALLGFWVGYFEKDSDDYEKDIYVDEGYFWQRENKINISIDKIMDSLVVGHSVVAGNDRPFKGTVKKKNKTYSFQVKEPGDHKYDGEFSFSIHEGQLIGKWTAYRDIDIKKRKYKLEKKDFEYNPNIQLEQSKEYVNWNKVITTKKEVEFEENEFEEWVSKEFASATNLIYTINASNTLLTKSEVENLKKGDLTIIRNTIYARHGYSFKNRPLRVFFDAQSWYIPVHTNIKDDFTALEKKNIQLLLRYEKNASEYYDFFGRG